MLPQSFMFFETNLQISSFVKMNFQKFLLNANRYWTAQVKHSNDLIKIVKNKELNNYQSSEIVQILSNAIKEINDCGLATLLFHTKR